MFRLSTDQISGKGKERRVGIRLVEAQVADDTRGYNAESEPVPAITEGKKCVRVIWTSADEG